MAKFNQCYGLGQGLINTMPVPLQFASAPTSSQTNYVIGQEVYVGQPGAYTFYVYSGAGVWVVSTSSAGNVSSVTGTTNQITATPTSGDVILTIPTTFVAPGSVAATTTLTATLGNITATNGNIVRGTAGNKDIYTSVASTATAGANSAGTVTLTGGTATVTTTAVTAASQIRLYRQGIGATGAAALGIITLGTKTAGVSFVINAVQAADATALQASDVSVIGWEIVN